MQQVVDIAADGFPGDTPDGLFAMHQWLMDAAKNMGARAFIMQKESGGEKSHILRVAPGAKIQ